MGFFENIKDNPIRNKYDEVNSLIKDFPKFGLNNDIYSDIELFARIVEAAEGSDYKAKLDGDVLVLTDSIGIKTTIKVINKASMIFAPHVHFHSKEIKSLVKQKEARIQGWGDTADAGECCVRVILESGYYDKIEEQSPESKGGSFKFKFAINAHETNDLRYLVEGTICL